MNKTIVGALVAFCGAILIAEAYKRYTTVEQKSQWEGFVKTHHGEAGALIGIAGALTKSPAIASMGVGLMVHDIDDYKKWFR